MQEVLNALRAHERFLLVSHVHPDGDAVGSLVALSLGLQQLGKEVTPILADGTPKSFQFLASNLVIQDKLPKPPADPSETLCVTLDLSDSNRTGFKETVKEYARLKKLAVIDHHQAGDLENLASQLYRQEAASSTAELVYRLLLELGVRLTPPIATALLTGMYTDTGGFQHDNTDKETLEIGAELMKRGARLQRIVEQTAHQKSVANLKLTGLALERLSVGCNGLVGISYLTHADLQETKATYEDVEGIVNQLNVLPETSVTLLLIESEQGKIRGSLRANDHEGRKSTLVTPFARLLGGGGHAKAAGFTLSLRFRHDDKATGQVIIEPVTS